MHLKTLITMTSTSLFTLGLVLASSGPVEAARPDRRQTRQTARIHQGAKSGSLTKGETARLAAGQAKVQYQKKKARADGKVTRSERRRIERSQDRQSRRIFRTKHNQRTRS